MPNHGDSCARADNLARDQIRREEIVRRTLVVGSRLALQEARFKAALAQRLRTANPDDAQIGDTTRRRVSRNDHAEMPSRIWPRKLLRQAVLRRSDLLQTYREWFALPLPPSAKSGTPTLIWGNGSSGIIRLLTLPLSRNGSYPASPPECACHGILYAMPGRESPARLPYWGQSPSKMCTT